MTRFFLSTMTALAIIGLTSIGQLSAQTAVDQYFSDWKNNPDFSIVNVSPKMFQIIQQSDSQELGAEAKDVINSLNQLKTIESKGSDSKSQHKEALGTLTSNGFEELMQLTEGGYDINILAKNVRGNKVSELVLLKSNNEALYMSDMVGDLDLTKVSQLSKVLNTPGMEHLKNIER